MQAKFIFHCTAKLLTSKSTMYIWGDRIGSFLSFLRSRSSQSSKDWTKMTDIFPYSLSCVCQKQHNTINFTWYQERRNSLYNKKIKKYWKTFKGHGWILKNRTVFIISDPRHSWDMHPQRGYIINAVGNYQIPHWLKNTLQEFEEVASFFSFLFAKGDRWSYESRVARLTSIK